MFAVASFRGWPKDELPPVQAIGVKHSPNGLMCFLVHVAENHSRAKTVRFTVYSEDGQIVERVRVEWPGWSDVDMTRVTLAYA